MKAEFVRLLKGQINDVSSGSLSKSEQCTFFQLVLDFHNGPFA